MGSCSIFRPKFYTLGCVTRSIAYVLLLAWQWVILKLCEPAKFFRTAVWMLLDPNVLIYRNQNNLGNRFGVNFWENFFSDRLIFLDKKL